MDLEFGQIFGSYRRDFVPLEAGILISDGNGKVIDIRETEFDFDGELVVRKNSCDSLGNPIGLEEKVYNPSQKCSKSYDPRFRISHKERHEIRSIAKKAFKALGGFCEDVLAEHDPEEMVFFGAQEDLNLLTKAGMDVSSIKVKDLQRELRREVGQDLSLDKISLAMGFKTDQTKIRSHHFQYELPSEYSQHLEPHMALGDVVRIFLLHREMEYHRDHLISSAKDLLDQIESYRNSDEEVPIF